MWNFKELRHGDVERNPHEAEFFRLTEPAESIVREVVQNSLDAQRIAENSIKVCFTFGEVERKYVKSYFEKLETHLVASNLLPSDYENPMISFLTIEDFGTTGLDGATGEDGSRPEKSNFFDFWWREGKSHKSGKEGGRWGLGKTTFHIASRIRSFWGLTVRQDDSRELLMGKALLKSHKTDNKNYDYYGYFTEKNNKPIQESQRIRDFKEKFMVNRNGESGLSIVIPFPDKEIKASSVMLSVIIHYFFPIMKGFLEVEIKESGNCMNLNAKNLMDIIQSQNWQGTSWEGVNVTELLQFINDSINTTDIIELGISDIESPEITEISFGEEIEEFKKFFNNNRLIALKVPAVIKGVKKESFSTYFEIFLKKYPQLKRSEEFYIRSGITIAGIKTLGNRPVRGMLVAEDAAITDFLGDAETPAHTEWNERTEGFKEKLHYSHNI